MAGQRRQRPGAGKTGAGQPARRAEAAGKQGGQQGKTPDEPSGRRGRSPDEPVGRRAARALNPRKPPTKSRVRLAALVFAALAVVLGVIGITVNGGYLRAAVLLLILAVLWGLRAMTMR